MTDLLVKDKVVLQNVELILLDKDGTIIDIHHYWGTMIKIRSANIVDRWFAVHCFRNKVTDRLMEAMGIDVASGRMKPDGPVGIKPRKFIVDIACQVLSECGVIVSTIEMEELFQEVDCQTAGNLAPFLRLLPGVKEFLIECAIRNIKLAVVSADMTARINLALETLGVRDFFDQIVGGDQIENGKPAPEPALRAMKLCAISPWQTASIGDHSVDIEMGVMASIPCNIGVLTGLGNEDELQSLPCHIAKSFKQISLHPSV